MEGFNVPNVRGPHAALPLHPNNLHTITPGTVKSHTQGWRSARETSSSSLVQTLGQYMAGMLNTNVALKIANLAMHSGHSLQGWQKESIIMLEQQHRNLNASFSRPTLTKQQMVRLHIHVQSHKVIVTGTRTKQRSRTKANQPPFHV